VADLQMFHGNDDWWFKVVRCAKKFERHDVRVDEAAVDAEAGSKTSNNQLHIMQ